MQNSLLPRVQGLAPLLEGRGGGVAPTLSSRHQTSRSPEWHQTTGTLRSPLPSPLPTAWEVSFLSLLFLQNPLRRFVTFFIFLVIFRLLKTFLSYQQVINNAGLSTQFF